MPRFLSAAPNVKLLPLPWSLPLEKWQAEYFISLPQGISRHVVRFIEIDGKVFAAKEVNEHLAIHEYRLLNDLIRLHAPAVEPVGVVTGRKDDDGKPLDSILLTKHLQFALPYRSLFTPGVREETVRRLVDALVVLLVRLHLIGFMWGDVSLSNILFRRDAGEFAAYLVDAETGELHSGLTDSQRLKDLSIGLTNIFGDFCDLESGGLLDESLDPLVLIDMIEARYNELWDELTGAEEFSESDLHRIEGRVRRLNAIGFDIAEFDIDTSPDGQVIRFQPKVVDAGHHSRRLLRLTGLDTEENQARRLLNDLDTYRLHSSLQGEDEAMAAHRWLTECFEAVTKSVPQELLGKRDPAQIYHELLDYRWYESQKEQQEVPLLVALQGYIADVLANLPDEEKMVIGPSVHAPAGNGRCKHMPADEDDLPPVVDPWEDGLDDDVPDPSFLEINALRAKAEGQS